jgi:hypothetical protein
LLQLLFDQKWGTGWGEYGYVRIRQGKGEAGLCGIARSPCVALGGVLLDPMSGFNSSNESDARPRESGSNDPIEANDSSHSLEDVIPYSPLENLCLRVVHRLDGTRCGVFADYISLHKAMVLGIVGLLATLLVVVWPLTSDCRRRAYHRRLRNLRKQQRQNDENNIVAEVQHDEKSTLLAHHGDDILYGTNDNNNNNNNNN